MKTKVLTSITITLLFLFINKSFAQSSDCKCLSDLNFLYNKLKNTLAYKFNKTGLEKTFPDISRQANNVNTEFDCYLLLNQLALTLNDNHIKIYAVENNQSNNMLKDSISLQKFKQTPAFSVLPKPDLNLDSLEKALKAKSIQDIEGIYFRKDYFTMGVFQNEKTGTYQAIILKSEMPLWEVGEVIYTMFPYGNKYFNAVGGSISSKRLISFTERIEDGYFLTMRFQKDTLKGNYSVSKFPDSTYIRRELSPDITYLKIGSFGSFYPTLSNAETFYKSIENKLNKKQLIIDLRDNGGGGDRNSDILYKMLKNYLKKNKVYLIVNHRTASNAEQFIYKMMESENVTILGDRTNGTAAYEVKDGAIHLPCHKFLAVLTAKSHPKYMSIESIGIPPDIELAFDKSWIEQAQNHIEKNN